VQRKVFVAKREEVTRDWIKVHIAKLHDSYLSPNNVRVMQWRRRKYTRHRTRWINLMERHYLENHLEQTGWEAVDLILCGSG